MGVFTLRNLYLFHIYLNQIMRKLYIISFLLLSISVKSQLSKGNWLIGGSVSFTLSNTTNYPLATGGIESSTSNIGFSISPTIGYFIFDKFAIGLLPEFSWAKSGSSSNDQYLIGPLVRYYILPTQNPVNLFIQISDQMGGSHSNYGSSIKSNINNFSIQAGPVIYFNESVGLEFTIGYFKTRTDIGPRMYTDTKSGFQTGIGFQIHLDK